MSEKLQCKRCDLLFTFDEAPVGKCPECNGTLTYMTNSKSGIKSESDTKSTETVKPKWSPETNVLQKIEETTLEDLVAAQNRTTYAVRSLALFFFVSLQTALLGGGLFGLAISNESHYDAYGNLNVGAIFFASFGAIIVLVGFFVAVYAGRQELNKSQP